MKKKNYEISAEVLEKATRCDHKECAYSDTWESCAPVDAIINNRILHLETNILFDKKLNCKYHVPFGGDHYCSCPVRLEIYKEYKI